MLKRAEISALGMSIAIFGLFIATNAVLDIDGDLRLPIAVLLCAFSGLPAGWLWPGGSWRWGLWVSSSFWVFLLFVFVSFLVNGEVQWVVAVEAMVITGGACSGAALSDTLARRLRSGLKKRREC